MLSNKNIIVTGAAGSLGQAVASLAKSYGANVIGVDIVNIDSLANTDQYIQVNLTDRIETKSKLSGLEEIDVLCNVAGGFTMGDEVCDSDSTQWQQMFTINVETMRNACMAVVPGMQSRQSGAIVNIGALGALAGIGTMSAYCCAKGSVMKLTESMSEELKSSGINVNAVLPSIIDTKPNREGMPDADFSSWVDPKDLAEVICFLASAKAKAIHGALIPVKNLV